jgi:hypothetical protein
MKTVDYWNTEAEEGCCKYRPNCGKAIYLDDVEDGVLFGGIEVLTMAKPEQLPPRMAVAELKGRRGG